MKPKVITKVVKEFMSTGMVSKDIIPIRDRFFSQVNCNTFKTILLHRIDSIVKQIDSINLDKERINIAELCFFNGTLRKFQSARLAKGLSLELEKPLPDRSY